MQSKPNDILPDEYAIIADAVRVFSKGAPIPNTWVELGNACMEVLGIFADTGYIVSPIYDGQHGRICAPNAKLPNTATRLCLENLSAVIPVMTLCVVRAYIDTDLDSVLDKKYWTDAKLFISFTMMLLRHIAICMITDSSVKTSVYSVDEAAIDKATGELLPVPDDTEKAASQEWSIDEL